MTDIANQPSTRGADWNMAEDNRNIKEKASTAKDAVTDLAGEAKRYATHLRQGSRSGHQRMGAMPLPKTRPRNTVAPLPTSSRKSPTRPSPLPPARASSSE